MAEEIEIKQEIEESEFIEIKEEVIEEEVNKISFKNRKRKHLRQRRSSASEEQEEEEDVEDVSSKLEEMRELQNLRKRPKGVNVIGLALGTRVTTEDDCTSAAMVMGFTGACRIEELCKMQLPHITDNGRYFIIKIPDSESGRQRAFVIADNPDESINYMETFKKYYEIRKKIPNNPRFFLRYHMGRCVNQPVGRHTFGKIPSKIAKFLKLPDSDLYTWRCFRRSSASSLEKSGVNILGLKRQGTLESSTITDSYVAESISNQLEPVNKTLYNQSKEYFKNVLDNLKIEPDEINQHINILDIDDPVTLENTTIWAASSASPSPAYSLDETLDTQDIPMEGTDGIQNEDAPNTSQASTSTHLALNGYKEEIKSDIEGPDSEVEEDDGHNQQQELHQLKLTALQNRIIHEEELHAQTLRFNEEKHQLEMELLRIKVDKEKNN